MTRIRESDITLPPRTRSRRDLVADLREHRERLRALKELACDFACLSIRAIVIIDGVVQPRDFNELIPPDLSALILAAATAIAKTEHELSSAEVA